ncbi:MAG: acyltransferase [Eudoraea sp.]|nr:1-acyl-sn-glycerol-3-phosphate acyltransferase [Eudoraea sp.]NNJ39970.1 acyltransferase [Eudoraea sp.]
MRKLASFIYFKLMGWKLIGSFPDIPKCVVIVAPHTSWVDFIVGLLVRKIVGLEINFIGKKSLFKPPFGWLFRKLGGTPVDRQKNEDTVASVARIFEEQEEFRLALSPEGTRKKVAQWRTGFYYIAKSARVPIVMVAFDFGKKEVKISEPVYTTGDKQVDFNGYYKFYEGVQGKIPEYGL